MTADRVLIVDNVFMGDDVEEAERLRDPSHVRNYSNGEWNALVESAGLVIEEVRFFDKPIALQPWLDRCGCVGEAARRVRELLEHRTNGDFVTLDRIAILAVSR